MSVLNTCTSSTRPSSPDNGALLYETDTQKMLCWDGAAWKEWEADNYISNSEWITVELPHRNSIYNGTGNTMVSYNYWMYSADSSKLGGHVWDSTSTLQNFSSDIGMNIFNGSDDVLIDAIRFRCNRPSAGAGSFGFHLLRFTNYQTATNPGRYSYRYANNTTKTRGTLGISTSTDPSQSTLKGLDFVHGDHTSVLLNDGTTGTAKNGLRNMVIEADPKSKDDTKSSNTDWWAVHGTSHSFKNWNPGDSGSYSSFGNYSQARNSFLNRSLAGGISSNGFGIYGGANMPQEVFFTFFFTSPLNMKGITCIDWMPWEAFGRTSLDINIEFRKYVS